MSVPTAYMQRMAGDSHPPPGWQPGDPLPGSGGGNVETELGVIPLALLPLLLPLLKKIRFRRRQPRRTAQPTRSPKMNPYMQALALRGLFGGTHGGGGYEDDDLGAEEYELDSIEGELDEIDFELDGIDDTDDIYVLGAVGDRQGRKISRLEAKLARIEDKISRTNRAGKRRRLEAKASRIRRKIDKVRSKLTRKLHKKVSKGKLSPTAAAAIAAGAGATFGVGAAEMAHQMANPPAPGVSIPAQGPATQAYGMQAYPAGQFSGNVPPTQMVNQVQRSPSAGEEIRLPLLVGGSPVFLVTIPIGAGLQTVPVTATTRLIPYAGFQIVGLDVEINAVPNADSLVNMLVSNYSVDGDKNLLYDTESVGFAGQTRGGTDGTGRRTIAGLRENQILQPTNTVSVTAEVRQEIANVAAINLTVQMSAICRSIWDPAVRR